MRSENINRSMTMGGYSLIETEVAYKKVALTLKLP